MPLQPKYEETRKIDRKSWGKEQFMAEAELYYGERTKSWSQSLRPKAILNGKISEGSGF